MMMPTQVFLDLLVGHTPGSSTRRRLTVPQASGDVEGGVDQSALPPVAWLLHGLTAEGDTALHMVASHGDNTDFLNCASTIDKRDQDLLFQINSKGDTPLHCAARAGKSKMVSCIINLAARRNRLHELLRKENRLKETALHDAVRIGNKDIVDSLLEADHELANYPREDTSPLYLAILLEKYIIARTLHDKSNGDLSYSGPNGQNALHAATSRCAVITKDILKWNNVLTTQGDRDGSTPLHVASSLWQSSGFRQLLEANPIPVYQADNNGLFPIHVAASVGATHTVRMILEIFQSSAGLRTAQGQTFLHVAIEKEKIPIVFFVCQSPSLSWILNMQDNDGNTALHYAVKAMGLPMFCALYANQEVHLSLSNNNKQTPRDISRSLLPAGGMFYHWNSDNRIYMALKGVGAKHSNLRRDQVEENYSIQLKPKDIIQVAEKMKDSSQMLGIGSVLITTVAFGATFALPGGYKADDHTNGGTPTFARRYTFDAFIMATTLAFLCSSVATVGLVFSGSSMVSIQSRVLNLNAAVFCMSSSVTSLSAAFALGVYIMLAPVARATGTAVCVLSPLVVLYRNFEVILKLFILARPLYLRMGTTRATLWFLSWIVFTMFMELWPFIIIFGWATTAEKLRNH